MGLVVGSYATVTVAIPGPNAPGEVVATENGQTQKLIAYASRAVPVHATVVIYGERPGRGVDVEMPGT